jgi:hypothetical protein
MISQAARRCSLSAISAKNETRHGDVGFSGGRACTSSLSRWRSGWSGGMVGTQNSLFRAMRLLMDFNDGATAVKRLRDPQIDIGELQKPSLTRIGVL